MSSYNNSDRQRRRRGSRRRNNKRKRARIIRAYILNILALLFLVGVIVLIFKGIAGIFKDSPKDEPSVSADAARESEEAGETDDAETFIDIDRDHSLKVTVNEDFEKGRYSEEELETFVDDEIKAFEATSASPEPVKLKNVNVSKGRAKLVMEYDCDASYRLFNGEELYVCPVADFAKYGITADKSFYKEDGSQLLSFKKDEINGYMAAVTDERCEIKVPGKILYHSDNVKLTGKKSAVCDGDGRAFVIYKRVLFEKKDE